MRTPLPAAPIGLGFSRPAARGDGGACQSGFAAAVLIPRHLALALRQRGM